MNFNATCEVNETGLGSRFEGVIRRAYEKTGRRVVILVDEYDKPMLQAIGNPELQEAYRSTLKGFYGALKSMDAYIRFALITGITKFGKESVFSDLDNLNDISMDAAYADICGLTEGELLSNFKPEISAFAAVSGMTEDECVSTLRTEYEGFHFHQSGISVYNPSSVLNAFIQKRFGSFWFETGTPTYLVTLIKKHTYGLRDFSQVRVNGEVLNSVELDSGTPIPALFQSGYLTIKGYDSESQAEYHTSDGRIDLVVKTPKFCYVMDFKQDGTAQQALDQISDKNYALPFALDGQQIIRLGISFNKDTRNIDEVLVG